MTSYGRNSLTTALRQIVALAILSFLLSATALAQVWGNDPKTESRINALLKQMTLEEKIGQLNQYSAGAKTGPGTGRDHYEDTIQKGEIGSLFNVTGPKVNEYQKIAVEKSRLKIPLIFGLDVIHGFRTVFPTPLAMSATWDPALIEKAARIAAEEASAQGVRWTFSPMVDIARDGRWGRIVEGAGEDPYLGSAIARAYVRGYQGTSLANPTSIAACVKHYVGYGAAEGGRDYNTTEIPERLLRQVYLPPFQAAKDEGAATFMSAFNALNGVPTSANSFTLDEVLRKEWKFRGFVVSDWTSIAELINHGIANDGATAARKAFLAGVDMDMESNLYLTTLADQVKSGKVPMAAVDEAVRRILRVKFTLGLFDHPYAQISADETPTTEHLALARTVAEKSFVLLKNDGILPLKPTQRIALVGPFADSAADMLGTWKAEGNPKDVTTLRAALQERFGPNITYIKGTEILSTTEEADAAGINQALKAAQQADVVIAALGEDAAWMTGEAASRSDLGLPGRQLDLLKTVASTGKPVVLVLFNGHPLVLNWPAQNVSAILEAWHPGVQGGPALVRTLYGENNPSGKLTVSFPRSVGEEPLYYNHLSTGRPLGDIDDSLPPKGEKDKYKSRYIDQKLSALYPFGAGLSYSTFTYSPVTLSAKTLKASDLNAAKATLTASAEITNTSDVAGTEVVQLYIRERGTSVARPVRELKGFRKVFLEPGKSKRVEFSISKDELSFWNIDMKNIVEPADVSVWISPNSEEGKNATLTIE